MLVTGRGVHLVAQVGGGHAGILTKGIHELTPASFRERVLTSRSTNAKTLVNSRCLSDRLVWRRSRSSVDPAGALAGTMTFSAFTVIRGSTAGTGDRQLSDRRRSLLFPFLFLAHDASS